MNEYDFMRRTWMLLQSLIIYRYDVKCTSIESFGNKGLKKSQREINIIGEDNFKFKYVGKINDDYYGACKALYEYALDWAKENSRHVDRACNIIKEEMACLKKDI